MPFCTFFGHRQCPNSIQPRLREVLVDLIENHNVNMFYVGNQGQFDATVRLVLRELQTAYPNVGYAVVLAYMPAQNNGFDFSDTMLPEGIETVHPRYAIARRNNWMLKQSDFVVTYIMHPWGGAYQYAEKAICLKKRVINIAIR